MAKKLIYECMTDFIEFISTEFKKRNWRLTAGVRNVTHILAETNIPLSVHDLRKLLQSQDRDIDPTTIYRIFDKLKAIEVLHEIHGRFIKCSDPENKEDEDHFLICDECGEAEEIFLDYFEAIASQLKAEKGFELEEADLSFVGVCRYCQEKE